MFEPHIPLHITEQQFAEMLAASGYDSFDKILNASLEDLSKVQIGLDIATCLQYTILRYNNV